MERKIEKSQIQQTINLKDIYGRDPDPRELSDFRDLAIERIIERTQDGKDINGESFASYTKEYASEKGVSVNDVDLTDMGDMLLGIDGTNRGSSIILEMDKDQAGKAHGNITGSYGKPSPDSSKARDFFGLNDSEIRQIANDVKVDIAEPLQSITIPSLFESREINIDEILRNIGLFVD